MKKLISILSVINLISLSSSWTISCNKKTELTLSQQETDVINAINQYESKYEQNSFKNYKLNNLSINDIIKINNLTYKNNQFTYDLLLKNYSQSKNIISSKYQYLNPEIKGNFIFSKNKIINNKLNILENLNTNYSDVLYAKNLLIGSTNDFIAIFNDKDWTNITNRILDKDHPVNYINGLGLKNANINLTDNDWENSIFPSLQKTKGGTSIKTGYSFLMHIVNKTVVYSNIDPNGTTNMPYANTAEDIKNNLFKISNNDYEFVLNKSLLFQLNDLFNYENKNFITSQIQNLVANKIWTTNCDINDVISNIKLMFNSQNYPVIDKLLTIKNNIYGFAIRINNGIISIDYPL